MKLVFRILVLTFLIWGGLALVGHSMTYYPMQAPNAEAPADAEEVTIATPDGEKLNGWWFETPRRTSHLPLATLYLHGNAGYLSMYTEHLRPINRAGTSVLIVDYRGFGKSSGSPNEAGLYTDAQAAYNWLRGRGYEPHQIIVQGLSLGTAVAVEIATRNPVGALILEAPFSSARAVAAGIVPVLGWTLPLGFESIAKIPSLKAPLLVMHGNRDKVIDMSLGRELFTAAPEPKEFVMVNGAGHENLPMVAGPRYEEALRRLYQRASQ